MPSDADRIADLARLTDPNASASGASSTPPPTAWTYLSATRTATYGFLAALPLLVIYEVGILLANSGQMQQIRVGADVWMKRLLAMLGGTGWMVLGVAVLVTGAVIMWSERKRRPPLEARYFGLIVAESLLYAVVLAFVVGGLVGLLFGVWVTPDALLAALAQPMVQLPLSLKLALSIGAGLYEELVFRVILVGGLYLLVRKVVTERWKAYLVAALVGAFVFSLVHYTGSMGDPFRLDSFTFRFLFGLALNGVFLVRGFAVAAWTHALYDVLVVTGSFG